MQPTAPHDKSGLRFGKYQLFAKLAKGGMAELFLAKQEGLGGFSKTVVLKCILPHLAEEEQFVTMFLDEARVAAHLNHPNIVQLYDIGEIQDVFYIAMEYIQGQSLKKFRKKLYQRKPTRPPYDLLTSVVLQAAIGLQYAHTATDDEGNPLQIIHRDISPTNLLLSYNGLLKIVDFGVAKARTQEHVTRVGTVKGKYRYMAPEQLRGEFFDQRADLFSLGVILYELTTYRNLFKRSSELETIQAVTQAPIPPPSSFYPHYPPRLEEIVLQAIDRNPQTRYQTADHFRADLEEFLQSQGHYYNTQQIAEEMRSLFAQEYEAERSGTSRAPLSGSTITRLTPSGNLLRHASNHSSHHTPTPPTPQNLNHRSRSRPQDSASLSPLPPTSPSAASPSTPPPSRSYLPLWLSLVLLLLGTGLAAWFFLKTPTDPHLEDLQTSIQLHVAQHRYVRAQSQLQRFQKLDRDGSYHTWIQQMKLRIRLGPRLQVAQQFYREGKLRAARALLQKLLAKSPRETDFLQLQTKIRLALARQHASPTPTPPDRSSPPIPPPPTKNRRPTPGAKRQTPPHRRRNRRKKHKKHKRYKRRYHRRPPRKQPSRLASRQRRPPTGLLYVTSTPSSRVELNGKLLGFTPLNGHPIPSGQHRLRLKRRGYRVASRLLQILPHRPTELHFTLRPLPSPRKKTPHRSPRPLSPLTPKKRTSPPAPPPKKHKPRLPFSSVRLPKRLSLRIYISDPRGIVGRVYTRQLLMLCQRIEKEISRLLGPSFFVEGITRPWQRFIRQQANRYQRPSFTFYPRAVAYVIYRNLARGRSPKRIAQLLISYQRRQRFRKLQNSP